MFRKRIANTLYVQIRKNAFRLRHIEDNVDQHISASKPFTTTRLLVGNFQEAERSLRKAISETGGAGLFRISPFIIMHPLEMVEGGLSDVEVRVFKELAAVTGARGVFVHVGAPLSDAEAVAISKARTKP